jgi:hypothetical protein
VYEILVSCSYLCLWWNTLSGIMSSSQGRSAAQKRLLDSHETFHTVDWGKFTSNLCHSQPLYVHIYEMGRILCLWISSIDSHLRLNEECMENKQVEDGDKESLLHSFVLICSMTTSFGTRVDQGTNILDRLDKNILL